jgi:hypothetical protein
MQMCSAVTYVTMLEKVVKSVVDGCWCLIVETTVWSEVVVTHSESFEVVIAEYEFFVHGFEESFDFSVRCGTMDFCSDVLNASLLAPSVEPAVLA